jgi:hypothetical protein
MGFLSGLISGLYTWLAKTFLGGLYGNELAKADAEATHVAEAAKEHAQSTQESADVEVQVIHDQVQVKQDADAKPVDETDPFGVNDWNAKK